MASAYKSAMRSGDPSDSDSDTDSVSSAQSSNTVQAESSDENEGPLQKEKHNDASQVPAEIRNRILMLTSRGVSYRYVTLSKMVDN
jgi:hypothetical protein